MRRRLCGWVAVCGAVLACFPGVAVAEVEPGWPFEVAAPTLVAFGESYVTSVGSHATHRGLDLGAPPGTGVRAVLAGTVTFAGRVPAGEGATTLAVTVQSGDILVTYLPLSDRAVAAGQTVAVGERLGALAASGDRSHPDSHLHLSVRRGSLYVDPAPFLAEPSQAQGGGAPVVEPAPAPAAPAPVPTGAAAPAPLAPAFPPASPVTAPAPAPAPALAPPAPTPAPQPVADAGRSASGAIVSTIAVAQAALPADAPVVARPDAPVLPPAGAQHRPPTPALTPVRPGTEYAPFAAPRPDPAPRAAVAPSPQAKGALAADRRERLAASATVPPGVLAVAASVLGVAFLWPLWRSVPRPSALFSCEHEDVAAVVAR